MIIYELFLIIYYLFVFFWSVVDMILDYMFVDYEVEFENYNCKD